MNIFFFLKNSVYLKWKSFVTIYTTGQTVGVSFFPQFFFLKKLIFVFSKYVLNC